MAETAVSLDDKYALESGRVYLTGTQALVRLPMIQRQRDAAAGLNTAAYVTGYRGSPLGALDQQMQRAKPFLERNDISIGLLQTAVTHGGCFGRRRSVEGGLSPDYGWGTIVPPFSHWSSTVPNVGGWVGLGGTTWEHRWFKHPSGKS